MLWSAGERSKPALSWENRYRAALGIAEALSYLHSGSSRPVIHRDVKSSNILLAEEFEPQVVTNTDAPPYTHGTDPSSSEAFRLDLNSELPVAAAIRFRAGHLGADEPDFPDAQRRRRHIRVPPPSKPVSRRRCIVPGVLWFVPKPPIDVFFPCMRCRYLAPEYFMYGKVTDRVDVYAFGVVLLELLSGRKPIGSDGSSPKGQESLVMWVRAPSYPPINHLMSIKW